MTTWLSLAPQKSDLFIVPLHQEESRDFLTCVDVAVFASVLRGDHGSHVCSGQGGEAAELPVQTSDVTGVGHYLGTRHTGAQVTPE